VYLSVCLFDLCTFPHGHTAFQENDEMVEDIRGNVSNSLRPDFFILAALRNSEKPEKQFYLLDA
jgi:hypothetical protein